MLAQFERHIEDDTPLADVLPTVFQKYPVRYRDYTLRELCQEMHNLYVSFDVKDLQKAMFRKESLPHVAMNPQDCHTRRAYCAWCRGRFGAARRSVIFWRWKRASICCLVFRRNCRGYIARPMPMEFNACTDMF